MLPEILLIIPHGKTEKNFLESFLHLYIAACFRTLFGKDTSSERADEHPIRIYGSKYDDVPYFYVNSYINDFKEMIKFCNLKNMIENLSENYSRTINVFVILVSDIEEEDENESLREELLNKEYKSKTKECLETYLGKVNFNLSGQKFIWSKKKFENNFFDYAEVTKNERKKHKKPEEYISVKHRELDVELRKKQEYLRKYFFEKLDKKNTNLLELIDIIDEWFKKIGE